MQVCQDVADFVGLALPLELLAALPPVLCVLCTITTEKKRKEKLNFQDFFDWDFAGFCVFFLNWDFVRQLASLVAA